jgi:hypothetical protein
VYIIVALILVVVIVVIAILLVTLGLPALRGESDATAVTQGDATATLAPTFTPGPTKPPTLTPPPPPSPTAPAPVMLDTDSPLFGLASAGARPGADWTGFFGEVLNAEGKPLAGMSVVVWYRDGTLASPIVKTDSQGVYEIRLADAPLKGTWTIQLLADDGQPASKLFTFQTDENSTSGIQQIQVIWQRTQ